MNSLTKRKFDTGDGNSHRNTSAAGALTQLSSPPNPPPKERSLKIQLVATGEEKTSSLQGHGLW